MHQLAAIRFCSEFLLCVFPVVALGCLPLFSLLLFWGSCTFSAVHSSHAGCTSKANATVAETHFSIIGLLKSVFDFVSFWFVLVPTQEQMPQNVASISQGMPDCQQQGLSMLYSMHRQHSYAYTHGSIPIQVTIDASNSEIISAKYHNSYKPAVNITKRLPSGSVLMHEGSGCYQIQCLARVE